MFPSLGQTSHFPCSFSVIVVGNCAWVESKGELGWVVVVVMAMVVVGGYADELVRFNCHSFLCGMHAVTNRTNSERGRAL